jgi:hypothetical protein
MAPRTAAATPRSTSSVNSAVSSPLVAHAAKPALAASARRAKPAASRPRRPASAASAASPRGTGKASPIARIAATAQPALSAGIATSGAPPSASTTDEPIIQRKLV